VEAQRDHQQISGFMEYELRPPKDTPLAAPRTLGKMFMDRKHLYLVQVTAGESSELFFGKDKILSLRPNQAIRIFP